MIFQQHIIPSQCSTTALLNVETVANILKGKSNKKMCTPLLHKMESVRDRKVQGVRVRVHGRVFLKAGS